MKAEILAVIGYLFIFIASFIAFQFFMKWIGVPSEWLIASDALIMVGAFFVVASALEDDD